MFVLLFVGTCQGAPIKGRDGERIAGERQTTARATTETPGGELKE